MKKITILIGLVLICMTFLFTQEQPVKPVKITLQDCILQALENNLDITIQAYNPEISEVGIRQAKEIFYPRLDLSYSNLNRNMLGTWGLEGTEYLYKQNSLRLSLMQKIVTGADIRLDVTNSATNSDREFTSINPAYYSNLQLNFTQPLLQGFGPKITRIDIRKAENSKEISDLELKSILVSKVFEVEESYWNLVYAVENLKVQELSLQQSQARMEKTLAAKRMGTKTALDVLTEESELASYQDTVLSAKAGVEARIDSLKQLLNLPEESPFLSGPILPRDEPGIELIDISFDDALEKALTTRPELAKTQKQIENTQLDVSNYRNQMLPKLDFNLLFWLPGQSGVRNIYLNNNPLTGVIVDTIEGSRLDSFDDIFKGKYRNWEVSLSLEIPLQNILSKSNLVQARIQEEQKIVEQEKIIQTIHYEVLDAIKTLNNSRSRIKSTARARELKERRLKAEEQRYELGLAGNEWLLQYQRQFTSAKAEEVRALTNYKIAVAKLEKVMGTNLAKKNIRFRDYDF